MICVKIAIKDNKNKRYIFPHPQASRFSENPGLFRVKCLNTLYLHRYRGDRRHASTCHSNNDIFRILSCRNIGHFHNSNMYIVHCTFLWQLLSFEICTVLFIIRFYYLHIHSFTYSLLQLYKKLNLD